MSVKEIILGIIAIIIILAAVASFFWQPVNGTAIELLKYLATGVVTYYFGRQYFPLGKSLKK